MRRFDKKEILARCNCVQMAEKLAEHAIAIASIGRRSRESPSRNLRRSDYLNRGMTATAVTR
jgi:hypothetical protein